MSQLKIKDNKLSYINYPDVLNQLNTALNSQDIPALILAAKPGYQFYSEGSKLFMLVAEITVGFTQMIL
ncbi:hypothetical protein KHA80_01890 [Anaerobacillus sp. HL2]|nr:hypothetical protein KHA80_01890 [Anaerobacillus sp. HL2]